ncbi:unnamed protein product [Absidia cylindrospora]
MNTVSKLVKDIKFGRISRLDAMIQMYNLCWLRTTTLHSIYRDCILLIHHRHHNIESKNVTRRKQNTDEKKSKHDASDERKEEISKQINKKRP